MRFEEQCLRDDGERIDIGEFLGVRIYQDEEVRRLNKKYIICELPRHCERLGKSEYEKFASSLFNLYTSIGECVGFEDKTMRELDKFHRTFADEALTRMGCLRDKRIQGRIVLSPTEKFLQSQDVRKREA